MVNPLDELSKVEFVEFLYAKKRKFIKHEYNGLILEDNLEWGRFEAKIGMYVYHNHKEICERIKTKSEKTIEIIELLINEKYEKEFETSKND